MKRTRFATVILVTMLTALGVGPVTALPAGGQAAEPLAGTWIAGEGGSQVEVVLDPNGRFTRTERDGEEVSTERGTYRFADGVLEIISDGEEDDAMRYGVRFLDDNTLDLTGEGDVTIRMTRKGAPPAQPPGLPPADDPAVYKPLAADRPEARIVAAGSNQLGQPIGHMNAAWSPDGKRLAFTRYVNVIAPAGQQFTANLFVANADGTGLTQITQAAINQCPMWPSWSPDGKRIAFYAMTNPNGPFGPANLSGIGMSADVWTIGADGADPKQLTHDGRSSEPAWGP